MKKNAPKPTPGQTGPRRPYPSISFDSTGGLCDLSRIASQPEARIVQWSQTPRLSGNRPADTFSSGVIEFASGYRCPACTTFGRGYLQLELPKDAPLNTADAAAAAAAIVNYVRAQVRVGGHV